MITRSPSYGRERETMAVNSISGLIAAEIMEDLQAALEQFKEIAEDLGVVAPSLI